MATREITMTASVLADVQRFEIERDASGAVQFRADAASPDSPKRDIRVISLAATSLSAAQKGALVSALATVLADLQAAAPAYSGA